MKNVVITIGTLLLLAGTAGAVAPTITTQPSPSTVTAGNATSFTVAYTQGTCHTTTKQWYLNGLKLANDTAYIPCQTATP